LYPFHCLKGTLHRLIEAGKPHRALFVFSLFMMFMSGLANVLPSWLIKVSIDGLSALEEKQNTFELIPSQIQNFTGLNFSLDSSKLLYALPIFIVIVFLIDACFRFLYQFSVRVLGIRIVRDLREKFHQHLNKMSLSAHSKYETGALVSVVSSDLSSLQSWLAESLTNLFNDGFKALFLLVWLFILDWKLTLISLISLPLFALPVLKLGKKIRSYSRGGQDYIGNVSSFITETLLNQKIIKGFNLETWRQEAFKKESGILYELNKKWVFFMALVSPITNVFGAIGISSILFLGLNSVTHGNITVGEFSSFFVTSILLYDPVKRIGRVSTIIQSAIGAADRFFLILDEEEQEIKTVEVEKSDLNRFKEASVEFKDINFSYNQSKKLFNKFKLKIEAKSSLALVGPSGGGKSTLLSLLARFYEIDSGDIFINSQSIFNMSLEDLRKNIAIVTQVPLLFSTSIKENILLGLSDRQTYGEEEIGVRFLRAAKAAHVTEFTQHLPDGLNHYVGERGESLSIGQKQRISLARAFISESPILLLDEPTSALDNESQAFVYDAINKLMKERTVLIIAHRLDTIKNCDQIIYLENGQIIESGNYEELSSKSGGAFSALSTF
jgi:ATP-binding cassette, subfamily B, bacterial MsbA